MSLNKEAILHLETNKTLTEVNGEISKLHTKKPLLVVPEGFGVKDLEFAMEHRTEYRFGFSTKSIDSFTEYCKEFDQEGAKCFINADQMEALTILDLGTKEKPLFQEHKASIDLQMTAAYKALLSIAGQPMNQKAAANFIDDWADNMVIATMDGEVMTDKQASKQLREITIEQVRSSESNVGDFSESMSQMEKIEAKNQDRIPSEIVFTCDPFYGLDKRAFIVKVAILTGESKPHIVFRIVKIEAQKEDMAKEFKELLEESFEESEIKTFIGKS